MKIFILILLFVSSVSILYGQDHLRTDSKIEKDFNFMDNNGMSLYPNGYISIFMKKARTQDHTEKLSYWRTNVFKNDSILGLNFGYDFDLMSEYFEHSKGNTFRYWNRFRMGIFFGVTNSAKYPLRIVHIWDILDGEITMNYLHIPHKLRGDQTLLKRRGYFEVQFSIRSNFDINSHIAYKPFGYLWLKLTYNNHYYVNSLVNNAIGLEAEVLINKRGYRDCTTSLTKDYYKGMSFIVGTSYDFATKSQYINVGVRLQTRNH